MPRPSFAWAGIFLRASSYWLLAPGWSRKKESSKPSLYRHAGKSQKAAGESPATTQTLRALRAGMDVALDFTRPLQKSPEIPALPPHEFPKLEESDLLHLDSAVSFYAPEKIRAAPGGEPVSAGCVPDEAQHVAHDHTEYNVGQSSGVGLQSSKPATDIRDWLTTEDRRLTTALQT